VSASVCCCGCLCLLRLDLSKSAGLGRGFVTSSKVNEDSRERSMVSGAVEGLEEEGAVSAPGLSKPSLESFDGGVGVEEPDSNVFCFGESVGAVQEFLGGNEVGKVAEIVILRLQARVVLVEGGVGSYEGGGEGEGRWR